MVVLVLVLVLVELDNCSHSCSYHDAVCSSGGNNSGFALTYPSDLVFHAIYNWFEVWFGLLALEI